MTPLRTTVIGSYPFPGWLELASWNLDKFGEDDRRELLDDAVSIARFLRMKRAVNLLVSDRQAPGRGAIVEGTYQSPILVQWRQAHGRVCHVVATLVQIV